MRKLLLATFVVTLQAGWAQDALTTNFNNFLLQKDYLGLRAHIRKQLKNPKLSLVEWVKYRNLIVKNVHSLGYDMIYTWDLRTPAGADTRHARTVRSILAQADDSMLKKDFESAFSLYQKVATSLKLDLKSKDENVRKSSELLYYHVLDGMGRSLYGLRRFRESAEVFDWIPVTYPKYRRVLFSQMWAWFQAGQVDQTLGRVASQFSAYFTDYHSPEAYLVQAYVLKKLCRTSELNAVIKKMNSLYTAVQKGAYTWKDWLNSDIDGFVLKKILEVQVKEPSLLVSDAERLAERKRIEDALAGAFAREKVQWLENMETAKAYALLSTGKGSALKPIEKLPSRQKLFQMKLEVWPADLGEIWADEIGSYRYVGESRCAK